VPASAFAEPDKNTPKGSKEWRWFERADGQPTLTADEIIPSTIGMLSPATWVRAKASAPGVKRSSFSSHQRGQEQHRENIAASALLPGAGGSRNPFRFLMAWAA
jgi:hypothetical protein